MSLKKDNHLLKQRLLQFRNQSLVRRSCTNICIYSTIMPTCKDKKSVIIAKFRKALSSFKYTNVGSGATVKLGYIVSMQQKVAVKIFCKNCRINIYLQKDCFIVKCQEILTSPFL